MSRPERPDWGGWGGRYALYTPPFQKWHLQPEARPIWTDVVDEVLGVDGRWHTGNHATIWRWRNAYQNDFAARMDWTVQPVSGANHPPVPRLAHAEELTARPGERGNLSAEGSSGVVLLPRAGYADRVQRPVTVSRCRFRISTSRTPGSPCPPVGSCRQAPGPCTSSWR